MKTISLVSLMLLLYAQTMAQGVSVAGHIPGCPDSMAVFACTPIGRFYNDVKKDVLGRVLNENFQFSFSQSDPGFMILENKCFKVVLFVEPGDSIFVETSYQSGKIRPVFSGSNAVGQDFLNNHKTYTGDKTIADIDHILSTAASTREALQSIQTLVKAYTAPLLLPLANGAISSGFYTGIVSAAESFTAFIVTNQVLLNFDSSYQKKTTKFTRPELQEILKGVLQAYDPFSEQYRNSPTAYAAALVKCNAINLGILQGEKTKLDYWKDFDKSYSKYLYAPFLYLDLLLGYRLVSSIVNNFDDAELAADKFNALKIQFPSSDYLPVVQKMLAEQPEAGTSAASSGPQLLAALRTDGKPLQPIMLGKPVTVLEELVRIQFKGKPVLIDCWATWCSPCKAEFKYEGELQAFLKANGVEMLYITFDFEKNLTGWKKFVEEYKLRGYHFFPDKAFKEALNKTLRTEALGIPRFILFDRTGRMLLSDASRPSSRGKFYDQLRTALRK